MVIDTLSEREETKSIFIEFDYPLTEISENSHVAWSTLNELFPKLKELGIVKETRQVGRARLYKLDTDNLLAQELIHLEKQLLDYAIRKIERQKVPA